MHTMTTPREHWAAMESRYGGQAAVGWCGDLLAGKITTDQPDDPAFDVLGGGRHLARILAGETPDYWIRVWAARGLLYVWDDSVVPAVVSGLHDDHWRVREMCAKVCRLHRIGEAAENLERLASDAVPRVRIAAVRALAEVGEAEHAAAVRIGTADPDAAVAAAARTALDVLSERLDRDLGMSDDDLGG